MRKMLRIACLAAVLSLSSVNFSHAEILPTEQLAANTETSNVQNPIVEVANQTPPLLTAPHVDDPKLQKHVVTKKIDLTAVIFDPDANFKAQAVEENREMTKLEEAQYNLHEALHGEVSAIGTKGLLADQMKMKFEEGPIEYIAPWIDYNGSLSNIWNGENYQNTTYGINFADIGFNIKMRDNKTEARFMFSPVRYVEGNTYFQSLFADNYVTRKIGKHNKILVGNTWVPLGIEGKESPLVLQYFTRSQTSRTYSSIRALGAKVMGDYDLFGYHLGVYSSGRFFKDFFPGPEVAGWVEVKPLGKTDGRFGKLTMGVGADAGNAQSHYAVATGAINYEYKRWRAITEFGMGDGSNGASGFTNNKSKGFNGTLAYRVTPKLQALVRYDQFDPNTDKKNDIRTEYTVGLNYFIKEQAMKLMLNYVLYNIENGTYGSRIMVGTQIVL